MKHISKKILSAIIFSAMILSTFGGCASEDTSSSETSDSSSLTDDEIAAVQKPGLKFTYGNSVESTDSTNELDSPDPTAATSESSENAVTSVVTVTDTNGAVVTEIAEVTNSSGSVVTTQAVVTDSAGTPVTDSNGETVTTVVNATEVVAKTEIVTNTETATNSNGNSSNGDGKTDSTTSTYQADMKSFNAIWLDVSENENYVFNDSFIEVSIHVSEDAPDGKYPINITWPDLACYDTETIGKTVEVDNIINGYVYVNTTMEEQTMPEDGLSVMAESVEAKPGDDITVRFLMKNNPGICAINFNFEYDGNALEIEEAYASGTFAEITGDTVLG